MDFENWLSKYLLPNIENILADKKKTNKRKIKIPTHIKLTHYTNLVQRMAICNLKINVHGEILTWVHFSGCNN